MQIDNKNHQGAKDYNYQQLSNKIKVYMNFS
jgi:hypothetical protein